MDVFKNNETVELWGRLCDSLLSNDRNDFRELQKDIERKYYNEKKAREHLESQFNIHISHIYRERNGVVDRLSVMGLGLQSITWWNNSYPKKVHDLMVHNAMGRENFRFC